jgi:hypothetical protein
MKPDLYTKAVLTFIALILTVIAFKHFTPPLPAVHADEGRTIQFASTGSAFYLYDPAFNSVLTFGLDGSQQTQITLAIKSK